MKSHLIASDTPLPSGSGAKTLCGALIYKTEFLHFGDDDIQGMTFAELQKLVTCTRCRKAPEPPKELSRIYPVTEAQSILVNE